MSALVIVPARLDSSRLPGKLLRRIGERTLLEWTYRAALNAGYPVLVATDSADIATEAERFGARFVLTGPANNGTERCALALDLIPDKPEIVVNWQGDSPMIEGWVARSCVEALLDRQHNPSSHQPIPIMATPVRFTTRPPCGGESVALLTRDHRALYFTRSPVPSRGPWWKHIGLYAYRADALRAYGREPGLLEEAERLEQLRWLEKGRVVQCVPVQCPELYEVNVPADLALVEDVLT